MKNRPAVMLDRAGFAMHQILSPRYFASKSGANRLMSKADSKQRNAARRPARKMANHLDADASILWGTRAGGNDDPLRLHRFYLADRDFIVASHLNRGTKLTQVLDEVVSERVVIVEHEDHGDILSP